MKKQRASWGNENRGHPAKSLTLSPKGWETLDALALRWGLTRSATVERMAVLLYTGQQDTFDNRPKGA